VKLKKHLILLLIMQLTSLKNTKAKCFIFLSTVALCRNTRSVPTGINRMAVRGCVWVEGCQLLVDKGSGLRSLHFPPTSYIFHVSIHFFARPVNRLSSSSEKCCLGNMGTLMENILESGLAVPWLGQLVASFTPRKRGLDPILAHMGSVVSNVALRRVYLRVLSAAFHQCCIRIFHYLVMSVYKPNT